MRNITATGKTAVLATLLNDCAILNKIYDAPTITFEISVGDVWVWVWNDQDAATVLEALEEEDVEDDDDGSGDFRVLRVGTLKVAIRRTAPVTSEVPS